ncbi:hypothetical protein [Pseudomonas sp. SW-3]|uniref:hypothetical protein n=1 Tax=Pseudomonas sp. SW-3 TaxID=147212 RepID=UPI001F3AFF9A|nr:hypothetical protein [Pseudomonas sp. SW-3]
MKTDWQQIREMMNTVIDSCEQIETAGFREEHRSATVEIKGVELRPGVFDQCVDTSGEHSLPDHS